MIEQGEHIRVAIKDAIKSTRLNHLFKPAQVYAAAVIQCGIAFYRSGAAVFRQTELSLTCWKNAAFWFSYSSFSLLFCGLLFFWHWLAPVPLPVVPLLYLRPLP